MLLFQLAYRFIFASPLIAVIYTSPRSLSLYTVIRDGCLRSLCYKPIYYPIFLGYNLHYVILLVNLTCNAPTFPSCSVANLPLVSPAFDFPDHIQYIDFYTVVECEHDKCRTSVLRSNISSGFAISRVLIHLNYY